MRALAFAALRDNDPGRETLAEVDAALDAMRGFVRAFAPDLAVIFGPDHYNGVFYDMMPGFCIGTAAAAVGDWGTRGRGRCRSMPRPRAG